MVTLLNCSYLLGLLAKIKCSICSYQLNLWYGFHSVPFKINLIFVPCGGSLDLFSPPASGLDIAHTRRVLLVLRYHPSQLSLKHERMHRHAFARGAHWKCITNVWLLLNPYCFWSGTRTRRCPSGISYLPDMCVGLSPLSWWSMRPVAYRWASHCTLTLWFGIGCT